MPATFMTSIVLQFTRFFKPSDMIPEMQNAFLILCLVTASIGFIIWYAFSSSLRLPVRYQIMYDANPPYVHRILRRRTLAALIYAGIPIFIIFCTCWIGNPVWSDLNISFQWTGEVARWTSIGLATVLVMSFFATKSTSSLEIYPELRVRFWRPSILILSMLSWMLYIVAYEFFYRGLLFQALLYKLDTVPAIVACTALYSLTHYFKLNRLTILSILWGSLACWLVLHTNSLWPAILIHLGLCLSTEWMSIRHHREMYVRRA